MLINWAPLFAHEVYVLTPQEISQDQQSLSPSVWQALVNSQNLRVFLLAGFFTLAVFAFAVWLKKTKPLKKLGKFIDKATFFAPDIIRVAFGASLIFSATHNALYGPELPLDLFSAPSILKLLLLISGIGLILGLFSRLFAVLAGCIFLWAMIQQGWYMLNYVNYLGEAIAVLLFPVQHFSVDKLIIKLRRIASAKSKYAEYSLPIARVLFGFSILYAAINVKFVTTSLSLDVVNKYQLISYLHFDPLFIVLGAALIECLIALLYIFGWLQRFNSVFFLFFLILSINFFNEDVWPHYLLIALAVGIFLHKPDKFTLDQKLSRRE